MRFIYENTPLWMVRMGHPCRWPCGIPNWGPLWSIQPHTLLPLNVIGSEFLHLSKWDFFVKRKLMNKHNVQDLWGFFFLISKEIWFDFQEIYRKTIICLLHFLISWSCCDGFFSFNLGVVGIIILSHPKQVKHLASFRGPLRVYMFAYNT